MVIVENVQEEPAVTFDIQAIVKKSFSTEGQQEGDASQFERGYYYINFGTEQNLMKTLPNISFKALNQFIAKHEIFLPSVLASGCT